MNVHQTNAAACGASYRFAIGQAVDHRDGGWPAVVVGRSYAMKASGEVGPEIYQMVLADGPREGELRTMLGEALVPLPY